MSKLNFLFWNTGKTANAKTIANMARENDSDIIILAENQLPRAEVIVNLNQKETDYQIVEKIFCDNIQGSIAVISKRWRSLPGGQFGNWLYLCFRKF